MIRRATVKTLDNGKVRRIPDRLYYAGEEVWLTYIEEYLKSSHNEKVKVKPKFGSKGSKHEKYTDHKYYIKFKMFSGEVKRFEFENEELRDDYFVMIENYFKLNDELDRIMDEVKDELFEGTDDSGDPVEYEADDVIDVIFDTYFGDDDGPEVEEDDVLEAVAGIIRKETLMSKKLIMGLADELEDDIDKMSIVAALKQMSMVREPDKLEEVLNSDGFVYSSLSNMCGGEDIMNKKDDLALIIIPLEAASMKAKVIYHFSADFYLLRLVDEETDEPMSDLYSILDGEIISDNL